MVGGVAGDDVTSHAPSEAALTFISVFPYFLHNQKHGNAQNHTWRSGLSYFTMNQRDGQRAARRRCLFDQNHR